MTLTIPFVLLSGYLLGSIPAGYLAGRWLQGVDIRTLGSGSTGATGSGTKPRHSQFSVTQTNFYTSLVAQIVQDSLC